MDESEERENPNTSEDKPQNLKKLDSLLLKDSNLTEEQVQVILQSFSVFDENGDGKISKRELARAYRIAGFNPTSQEVDEIIKEHDMKGDGYIDFEEYFSLMKERLIKLDFEKERIITHFKVLDLDKDGYITATDLEHALSKNGKSFTETDIMEIIRKADTNCDGKIDYNGRFRDCPSAQEPVVLSPHMVYIVLE